jgi:hypothetical protein
MPVPVADGGIDYGGNTNWQDQIFRNAISQNYNLELGWCKDNTGKLPSFVWL